MKEKIICIQGDKGSGKTTKLIELADKYFCYLVVRNMKTAQMVKRKAKEKGKSIPFPLTYKEFINKNFYGKGINCFIIDDIETLLCCLADEIKLKAFSIDTSTVKIVDLNTQKQRGEIKREIAKIISSSRDLQGATWEELKKIDKLVNLFKSYARSLVPDMQHYDNDDVKNPDPQFRVICAYKDGYNACREEMLNEIDNETDNSPIVKDGWKINKEGKIEIQTGLDKHDDKWSVNKYREFKE